MGGRFGAETSQTQSTDRLQSSTRLASSVDCALCTLDCVPAALMARAEERRKEISQSEAVLKAFP